MSALFPKADIPRGEYHVRFVPKADIARPFRLFRRDAIRLSLPQAKVLDRSRQRL
jgi:hypothetical protein